MRGALDMPLLPNQRLHLQREVCFLLRPMLKPRTKKRRAQESVLTALTSYKGRQIVNRLCNQCDRSALSQKPIDKGVMELQLTCFYRQSARYLMEANQVCEHYMRHHGDEDGE